MPKQAFLITTPILKRMFMSVGCYEQDVLTLSKGATSVFKDGLSDNSADVDTAAEAVSISTPRHTRRLSDKLFVAFHQACDTAELDVAEQLLGILEKMMTKRSTNIEGNRRRNMEGLVAAFERLWNLRHPEH